MALSARGAEYAEALIRKKLTELHHDRHERESHARGSSAGSTGAWLVALYEDEMRLFGSAMLESYREAFATDKSQPDQRDVDEIGKRIEDAVRARADAGQFEIRRVAQVRGTTVESAAVSELTRAAFQVASDIRQDLNVWKLQRELEDSGGPLPWWLHDSDDERDALLQLASRGALDRDLVAGLSEAATDHPLALLFCDIDHFKSVNDQHGHSAGDAALTCVAAQLKLMARGRGKAFRYGGEELVILLPNAAEAEAVATAERLRTMVESTPVPDIGTGITISIGVAIAVESAMPPKTLIDRADRALYSAKAGGRNKVVAWTDTLPPRGIP